MNNNSLELQKILFEDFKDISYQEALDYQKTLFEKKTKLKQEGNNANNHLIFCEHLPVYTLGKRGDINNLLINEKEMKKRGIDFFQIQRGGDITFHGKGQITAYPIFDLETFKIGLREYVEKLERIIIQTLAYYNIEAETVKSATGVWIERQRKICAIGIRSSRWITMHGFAFNVNTDLEYFDLINPCGFKDKGVTSIARELQKDIDIEEVKGQLLKSFENEFQATLLL